MDRVSDAPTLQEAVAALLVVKLARFPIDGLFRSQIEKQLWENNGVPSMVHTLSDRLLRFIEQVVSPLGPDWMRQTASKLIIYPTKIVKLATVSLCNCNFGKLAVSEFPADLDGPASVSSRGRFSILRGSTGAIAITATKSGEPIDAVKSIQVHVPCRNPTL